MDSDYGHVDPELLSSIDDITGQGDINTMMSCLGTCKACSSDTNGSVNKVGLLCLTSYYANEVTLTIKVNKNRVTDVCKGNNSNLNDVIYLLWWPVRLGSGEFKY